VQVDPVRATGIESSTSCLGESVKNRCFTSNGASGQQLSAVSLLTFEVRPILVTRPTTAPPGKVPVGAVRVGDVLCSKTAAGRRPAHLGLGSPGNSDRGEVPIGRI